MKSNNELGNIFIVTTPSLTILKRVHNLTLQNMHRGQGWVAKC